MFRNGDPRQVSIAVDSNADSNRRGRAEAPAGTVVTYLRVSTSEQALSNHTFAAGAMLSLARAGTSQVKIFLTGAKRTKCLR